MKSNMHVVNDCQRHLKVEVPLKEISAKYDQVYTVFSNKAEVPGFRRGKAPRHIIEQHFSLKVKEEVLSQLISQSYQQAVEENKLEPVAQAEISQIKFEENKPLTFTATIDIKPQIKLKNYKGITIKKINTSVAPEEIDKALAYLQENLAIVSPVLEERPVREGDFILSDIECFVDGSCIDKRQNTLLFLGPEKNNQNGNFSQQLFGAKPGETRMVNMSLPKDYPKGQYASQEAQFNISIKQIKEKKLPEVNDALAKQIGNYQNVEELKEVIKKDLVKKKERQTRLNTEEEILEYLAKENDFCVPPSLVKRHFEYLQEKAKHKLEDEKLKPEAEKQVKIFFLLNEIAKAEKIKVTSEEISKYNLTPELAELFLREKTMDFLVKEAKISEEG